MGETTGIAWCDHTFNPFIGCTKVAPECEHCYAQTYGNRFGVEWGPLEERRRTSASNWREPIKWDAAAARDGVRRRVFCASLADVFEDRSELEPWRAELFSLIERCRNLDWLLLTKRPENMVRMAPESWADGWPSHVWAGTSAGCQPSANKRIPLLLQVPSAVHFLSCEPLIGEVELQYERGWLEPFQEVDPMLNRTPRIDWVIVGAESGPGARTVEINWVRSILAQCRSAGVACFIKQLGRHPFESVECLARNLDPNDLERVMGDTARNPPPAGWCRVHTPDGRQTLTRHLHLKGAGADPAEWPEDLRRREFPT